jgi:hypothetical protein
MVTHMWDEHRMGDEIFELEESIRELHNELREAKDYDA